MEEIKKELEEITVEYDGEKVKGKYIFYDDAIKFIKQKLKKAQDDGWCAGVEYVQKWISVKDRLPETEDRYAILYRYKDQTFLKKWIGDFDPIEKKWLSMLDDIEVLYWMPLPDPPKNNLLMNKPK